jgi:hypothetical protein
MCTRCKGFSLHTKFCRKILNQQTKAKKVIPSMITSSRLYTALWKGWVKIKMEKYEENFSSTLMSIIYIPFYLSLLNNSNFFHLIFTSCNARSPEHFSSKQQVLVEESTTTTKLCLYWNRIECLSSIWQIAANRKLLTLHWKIN